MNRSLARTILLLPARCVSAVPAAAKHRRIRCCRRRCRCRCRSLPEPNYYTQTTLSVNGRNHLALGGLIALMKIKLRATRTTEKKKKT